MLEVRQRDAIRYWARGADGSYGIAVLKLEDEAAARAVTVNDPAIKAQAGFSFEVHPMPDAQVRP